MPAGFSMSLQCRRDGEVHISTNDLQLRYCRAYERYAMVYRCPACGSVRPQVIVPLDFAERLLLEGVEVVETSASDWLQPVDELPRYYGPPYILTSLWDIPADQVLRIDWPPASQGLEPAQLWRNRQN